MIIGVCKTGKSAKIYRSPYQAMRDNDLSLKQVVDGLRGLQVPGIKEIFFGDLDEFSSELHDCPDYLRAEIVHKIIEERIPVVEHLAITEAVRDMGEFADYGEIAELLGVTRGSVTVTMHRAKVKIEATGLASLFWRAYAALGRIGGEPHYTVTGTFTIKFRGE